MLANHDQKMESRLRLDKSVVLCKIGIEWLQDLLVKIYKARSIETRVDLIFYRNSNFAQAYMTCRVKYFTSSIKGQTLATF